MSVMTIEPLTHAEAEHLDCSYCGQEACPDECNDVQLIDNCASLSAVCGDCHRDLCRASDCDDPWEE